jgi:hypothetical protein
MISFHFSGLLSINNRLIFTVNLKGRYASKVLSGDSNVDKAEGLPGGQLSWLLA